MRKAMRKAMRKVRRQEASVGKRRLARAWIIQSDNGATLSKVLAMITRKPATHKHLMAGLRAIERFWWLRMSPRIVT